MLGPVLEVEMSKRYEKVHAVVAQSTFRSQTWKRHEKTDGFGALLDVRMLFCVAGAREYAPLPKVSKT